ncbi:MBL fold metallo-hydrolase RNA specificity domain-containing protein [Motilimonas eburnea]|uniref:MBL fold metallo-hydrolase RNA specificity domain-containing protein n=1 Tax=Motilimonas eburnea TaxID=1737488 RepID=UPI001E6222FE|nr:MBL fold metallo-hydrolase [Motilimonas eburnea]MCE2573515.1 MBL fold metallo-hydrolase [Motilimonas eburnea]
MEIRHWGSVDGVTGSCHELVLDSLNSVLIDCGLFQGAETAGKTSAKQMAIEFDLSTVKALVLTHCHIDHVGRIPYLFAAGFNGPIYATVATAAMLPMILRDALKLGVTKDKRLIDACIDRLNKQLVAVEFNTWQSLPVAGLAQVKFKPAGHILGSAYLEFNCGKGKRVVFSGDLGAPYTPLLPAPKSPYQADVLVIESTYGDHCHQGRQSRAELLQTTIEKAVADNGVVLIPAFSIGRTQELLYELEEIVFRESKRNPAGAWANLEVIIDSPMAASFTDYYSEFSKLWDKEAKRKVAMGRHPLDFSNLYTVGSHQEHLQVMEYLAKRNKPAIVIAASGMCSGGRIVNYLANFLGDETTDVLFVGYQAKGSLGRDIQQYGPDGGYVFIDDQRIDIKAGIHTLSGYSAHADQKDLLNFVKRMRKPPTLIKIVHGDDEAKQQLAELYRRLLPDCQVEIAQYPSEASC